MFQLVSDLHLENYYYKNIQSVIPHLLVPSAKYLIVAGDCVNFNTFRDIEIYPNILKLFLDYYIDKFEKILYICGNHEHYGTTLGLEGTIEYYRNYIKEYDVGRNKVIFLEKDRLDLEDINILGLTLWTKISNTSSLTINDYRQIRKQENGYTINLTYKDTLKEHEESVKWLSQQLDQIKERKVMIISHHMPSFQLVDSKYKNARNNDAFASDLNFLMESYPNIQLWCFGHVHESVKKTIANCECLCNPRGNSFYDVVDEKYNKEKDEYSNKKYSPNYVVEL